MLTTAHSNNSAVSEKVKKIIKKSRMPIIVLKNEDPNSLNTVF